MAADNAFPAQVRDAFAFYEQYLKTADEFKLLLKLQKKCEEAWTALETEYVRLGLSVVVTNYITEQKRDAADTLWIQNGLNRVADRKDRQYPVARDANNARKMRKCYLSRRRRESTRRRKAQIDATSGWSGFDANWIPWRKIGEGGQGTAWIWILFDQNNRITRVRNPPYRGMRHWTRRLTVLSESRSERYTLRTRMVRP